VTAHSVAELREAWRAIEAGEFAEGARPASVNYAPLATWEPSQGEKVIAVLGCAGGVGASTLALAMASASGAPTRVVECCPPSASGFSAAANAELGVDGPWRRGSRGDVLLERRTGSGPVLPAPAASAVELTILDAGWAALSDPSTGWPGSLLRPMDEVVLVTGATVPGLRHLESCIELLGRDALGVVVGPTTRQWPRPVKDAAAGMPTRARLVSFPMDPRLRVTGLTPDPMPTALVKAAQNVLALLRKEPS